MSGDLFALARPFLDAGVLAPSDVHAVALVAPRFGETDAVRMLGLAFAVRAPRVGHAGVDLRRVATQVDAERTMLAARVEGSDEALESALAALPWPHPRAWHDATVVSPLVAPPTGPLVPFVAQDVGDRTLLLTRRMYREQEMLADALLRRAKLPVPDRARIADLDATLARLFPDDPDGESARAVRLAANERLAIVVGGPGTGKTYSITRLLAALLASDPSLVVRLAAPTGKAAVRMREAIREGKRSLDAAPPVLASLNVLDATTLHRLLGMRPDGTTRHGRADPIPADVVVVDEVSMVDLALMRRLVEAVHDDARLVLLGDRDQLASVEAGCVLADLVGDGAMEAHVQSFTRTRRFATAPDVALIASCLQGHAPSAAAERDRVVRAVSVFAGRAHADAERHPTRRVTWLGAPETRGARPFAHPTDAQLDALAAPYVDGFDLLEPDGAIARVPGYAALLRRELSSSGTYSAAVADPLLQRTLLDALDRYRVLAVHRRGPLGVAALDRAMALRVRALLGVRDDGPRHWIGRPILVTENAYDVALMNGDVGLVLPTPSGLAAVFPHERPGEIRAVALSRLPAHDGALAMTVHKSQGSQFDRVALVLAGRPSPIETRELVYTGVTRAKNQLAWLGDERELADALERRVERASGLRAMLG